jgi:uncharacterized membrane protein YesL
MQNLPAPLRVIAQAFVDWWDDWIGQIIISLAWMLCWATLVLGPPATLGLYHVTNRLAHGEGLGLGGLVAGGRRYFFKSWLWATLNLLALLVITVDLTFYAQIQAAWAGLLSGTFIVLGLAWLLVQFYALPFLVEQEHKSLKMALRNGLFVALASPGYTLVVVGVTVLILALSTALVFPLFMGVPSLVAAIGNRAVIERIETFGVHEREAQTGDADER